MLIGYARVSTDDQKLELQLAALRKAGCKNLFHERVRAGNKQEQPALQQALGVARKGDSLVVWKLDRLGRTVKGLIELVDTLHARGIQFRSLTESLNTSTPAGRLFFHLVASFAQMERELICERTQAGIRIARARGRLGGRPKKMTESKMAAARKLLSDDVDPKTVARDLGISISTLYRYLPGAR